MLAFCIFIIISGALTAVVFILIGNTTLIVCASGIFSAYAASVVKPVWIYFRMYMKMIPMV